jgi:hypothetical protein
MSDAIKKRMEELKEKEKLTDFQHTHLLCLNTIMDSLVSIAESLKSIDQRKKLEDDKWRHTV